MIYAKQWQINLKCMYDVAWNGNRQQKRYKKIMTLKY